MINQKEMPKVLKFIAYPFLAFLGFVFPFIMYNYITGLYSPDREYVPVENTMMLDSLDGRDIELYGFCTQENSVISTKKTEKKETVPVQICDSIVEVAPAIFLIIEAKKFGSLDSRWKELDSEGRLFKGTLRKQDSMDEETRNLFHNLGVQVDVSRLYFLYTGYGMFEDVTDIVVLGFFCVGAAVGLIILLFKEFKTRMSKKNVDENSRRKESGL
jgi:hypothetical protein